MLHGFDILARLNGEIDNVELAFLAEDPLRRRQIHQSETAAKHFGRALLLEQRAHSEFPFPLAGQKN